MIGADSKISDISKVMATLHYQRDIMGRGALLLTTTTIAILLLSGCSSKQSTSIQMRLKVELPVEQSDEIRLFKVEMGQL